MRSREAIDAAVRDARDAISEIVREVRASVAHRPPMRARGLGKESERSHREAARIAPARPQSLREALANRGLGTGAKGKKNQPAQRETSAAEPQTRRRSLCNRGPTASICAASAPTKPGRARSLPRPHRA